MASSLKPLFFFSFNPTELSVLTRFSELIFSVSCWTEVKKELEEGDEPRAETESESEEEEEELSCFAPTVRTLTDVYSWSLETGG